MVEHDIALHFSSILEWLGPTTTLGLIGKVISDYFQRGEDRIKIDSLLEFKRKVEESDTIMTIPMHDKEQHRCRTEVFGRIEKTEEILADLAKEQKETHDAVIRVETLLKASMINKGD